MKMLPTRERPAPTRLVVPAVGAFGHGLPTVDGRGPVTDYPRPLLLGYARRDLYLSDRHVSDLKRELGAFAHAGDFAMGSLYVEDPETAPAAFEAMVASVNRYEITAVVLPSMRHLALVGDPADVHVQFERVTGARIMLHEATP
jgi:hypothetical protein